MPVFNRFPCLVLPLRHIIGALLTVLVLLGLPGCSTVKLGYQNAPELGYWWLDSYLDFNDAQSLQVRAELAALQTWHRQSELPLYVSSLDKLQRLAPANVSAAQVCGLIDALRPRLQILLDRLEPAIVTLAPTLTPAQLEHLARQFEKRQQKWRDEWLLGTAQERQERRLTRLSERAERFYGRLDESQLAILRASVDSSPFDASLGYRELQRRYRDTLRTLRQLQGNGVTGTQIQTQVHELLARSLRSPESDYRQYADRLNLENCTTLSALHNSTNPAQRRQLADTLKDYASDARTLMARGS
jgi:hypothetical protein